LKIACTPLSKEIGKRNPAAHQTLKFRYHFKIEALQRVKENDLILEKRVYAVICGAA
jgi:hypothetical protein